MKILELPFGLPKELFTWTLFKTYAYSCGVKDTWENYKKVYDRYGEDAKKIINYAWDNVCAYNEEFYHWIPAIQYYSWICGYGSNIADKTWEHLQNFHKQPQTDQEWFELTAKIEKEFTDGIVASNPFYKTHLTDAMKISTIINSLIFNHISK